MIMMMRDRDYCDLLKELSGKRVLLWTCNACARESQIGGEISMQRLADALLNDGVDVVGAIHASASCIEEKVVSKYDAVLVSSADVILSLTCDVGAHLVGKAFGISVVNPVATLGPGYIDCDGGMFLKVTEGFCDIEENVSGDCMGQGPFV